MSETGATNAREAGEAWRQAVSRALKGADFEAKLVGRTSDGIRIEPLYAKSDNPPVAGRGARHWVVSQRMDHPDVEAANAQALHDLENGASGLTLTLSGSPAARGFGLVVNDVADLDIALAGVHVDLIQLRFETALFDGRRVASLMRELVSRRGLAPDAVSIDLGLDPLGDMARAGSAPLPAADLLTNAGAIARTCHEEGFGGTFLRADGRPVHEAGGSEAQELAFVLSSLVAYLRALEAAGLDLDAARRRLSAVLVVDADEFLSVAKLRALRRLWARVEDACGLSPVPLAIHAETAWRAMTRRDPWVNLLRGTMGTFCAAIGGADGCTVLPFTAALGLPDGFARRLARNTQLVLADEANLWRVADPAAGAGGFEALTDALCEKAWELFQQLEADGGIASALVSGSLQRAIAATRGERQKAIARRKEAITGTSEFPDLRELPVSVLDVAPHAFAPSVSRAMSFEPLPSTRSAEPFEALRDRSDEFEALHGVRPRVFLANLGPIPAFSARAGFAKNLFEAGGIEAVGNDGFSDAGEVVAAFRASGASLACLCSSDELYASPAMDAADRGDSLAAATARVLAQAGAAGLYLAGRPGDHERAWRDAGIHAFLFAGCDALAVLRAAHEAAAHDEPVG